MMVPKKSLFFAGALLTLSAVASAQQGGSPVFRRVTKPAKTVSLNLETGTLTRGPAVKNKAGVVTTTMASLTNNDFSGFVGVDSGIGGANGPCEWIQAAVKGPPSLNGGKSGFLTGFVFAYCSAALDPASGGPGGSAVIGFRSGYSKGTAANAGGPTGTSQGLFLLSGLPANTNCSSFFGGFACYLIGVTLGTTPVALPDGPIGYSWRFTDLGTDGVLAKTFPFLACVNSCSGTGPDVQGMTDGVDQYCPAGTVLSSFAFTTAIPYYTSLSMELDELIAVTGFSNSVNGAGTNFRTLANTSNGFGGNTHNYPILGKGYRVDLNCSAAPIPPSGIGIIRASFAGTLAVPLNTKWGQVLVFITAGTGQNFILPLSGTKHVVLSVPALPLSTSIYGVCFAVQGFCPKGGPGLFGTLSNARPEKIGSK
jgi:hypothetical protein